MIKLNEMKKKCCIFHLKHILSNHYALTILLLIQINKRTKPENDFNVGFGDAEVTPLPSPPDDVDVLDPLFPPAADLSPGEP